MTAHLDPPVFQASPHSTTKGELDSAFASVVARLNSLQDAVDGIVTAGPGTYAPAADLAAHLAASVPHGGFMSHLTVPSGKRVMVQTAQITLSGGTYAMTWATPVTTVLSAMATVVGATAHAVSVSSVNGTGCTVNGTGTDVVNVLMLGYV